MRRFIVCALIAGLAVPAIIAIPPAANAEPLFCAGLRKKANLARWEFEAFNKSCTGTRTPSDLRKPAEVIPAQNVVTAASLVGDMHSNSGTQTDTQPLPGAIPDKHGFLRVRPADIEAAKTTIKLQQENAAPNAKTVVAEKNVADTKAAAATNVARSAEERLSYCGYKLNALTLVAGLTSLARAPKLRDGTQLLSLAAPLPFSRCEKPVDAPASAMVVPVGIGLVEGGDPVRLHILEGNYKGSFALTPSDGGVLSIEPVLDGDKKTVLRDQFDVKAIKFADTTSLTVQDESGGIKTIHVSIKKKST